MQTVRFILFAAALAVGSAFAQDARLAALHATLVELRGHIPDPDAEMLGATPQLTVAKHQLREWIETQLASLEDAGDTKAFAVRINQALKGVSAGGPEEDQNLLGSLSEVRLGSEGGLLIVTSGVGIICQYDESSYAYKRVNNRWQRVWESEQDDYRKGKYSPQFIEDVHVLQPFNEGHENGPPFLMTLGHFWGCASTWHDVTYRVWRLDPAAPKLLIDRSEWAWMRTLIYIVGSIGQRFDERAVDVQIEFTESSIDVGVHNREAVRHFLIDGDRVTRVDPVALSPRDFVDEWLTRPWEESTLWSASGSLKQWYGKLHADFVSGEFGETMHCATPDLWQVTVTPHDAQKNFAPGHDVYFLVRWRPPYHFTMVSISDKTWPRCSEKDLDADAWRTLFATQEWRW